MTERTADRGRPTRRAIVETLAGSTSGMTATELAEAIGVHPNAVRRQLRTLVRDGSVGSARELSGRRGRPAARYRASGARREAAATQRLARMLVELVGDLAPDEARVEEFGRRQAPGLAAAGDGRRALLDLMTAMGFAPREVTGAAAAREGALEVVLEHCPFRDAVNAGGGRLVCVLHRGISQGLVEMTPGARLSAFESRPPEAAGCRIVARGLWREARDG